jgi:hypothetical protein
MVYTLRETDLAGAPRAMAEIRKLGEKMGGRVPFNDAYNVILDTPSIVSHGSTADFVLEKLVRFGMISVHEDPTGRYIIPKRILSKSQISEREI